MKDYHELEGAELDEAVAKAIGVEPGANYSSSWHHAGPLIERFDISLSSPGSRVHRHGGLNPGWGESGVWGATSWRMKDSSGKRRASHHETSALTAAMRLIVMCEPYSKAAQSDSKNAKGSQP
jgi:hypothetical protein